jgi:hypothetical protein
MNKNRIFLEKTLSQDKYKHYLEELPNLDELQSINTALCELGCFVYLNEILEVLKELKLKRNLE